VIRDTISPHVPIPDDKYGSLSPSSAPYQLLALAARKYVVAMIPDISVIL
jgi:hypothetical protein